MMEDDHSLSRKRKMENDLLSDLPLGIIHCILELVPIRDAVRICILSRQWRYKWASLPRLVFDHTYADPEGESADFGWKCLKDFITTALFLHKGPIHKFGLSVSSRNDCPDIDHWLLWLSRKNEIRELFLDIKDSYDSWFRVHSSLYSLQKLTHLELVQCELRVPPLTFKGFSCLKSLILRRVKMPSEAVESLVANSPLLESFTYIYIGGSETGFRISAPKLTYFELVSDFKEIDLYAPLVAKVSVLLGRDHFTAQQLQQKSSVCNYTKFLGGFTNLESLSGRLLLTKYLSIGIESYDHSQVFHRLKIIQLYRVNFHDIKEILVVVRLITGSPNLQELKLSASAMTDYASKAPHVSFGGFECAPNFTLTKLRVINISDIRGLPYEKELINFLLKSSPVLVTVTLVHSYGLLTKVMLNLTTELLRYRRASPDAEILFIQS